MNAEWVSDVIQALITANLGTSDNVKKTRPAKWNPEELLILVAPSPGTSGIPATHIEQPRLQVLTFCRTYATAWNRCHAIFHFLRDLAPVALQDRTFIHTCEAVSPPVPIGQDAGQAYGFSVNFSLKIGAL